MGSNCYKTEDVDDNATIISNDAIINQNSKKIQNINKDSSKKENTIDGKIRCDIVESEKIEDEEKKKKKDISKKH